MIVICQLSSWYHFLGLCSFLESQSAEITKIILLQETFFDKQTAINPDKLKKYCKDIHVIYDEREILEIVSRERNKKIILATPSLYPFRVSRCLERNGLNHTLVILEEGIGAYGSVFSALQATMREEAKQFGAPKWKSAARFLVKYIAKKILLRRRQKDVWHNYHSLSGEVNWKVVDCYKSALDWLSLEYLVGATKLHKDKYIVIATSPFVELGLMSVEEFKKIIRRIIDDLPLDVTPIIKPHPIEDQSKYEHLEIIDPTSPLEAIVRNLGGRVVGVYCFSSTTAYTIPLYTGVQVHHIKEHDKFFNKLSLFQKKIMSEVGDIHRIAKNLR